MMFENLKESRMTRCRMVSLATVAGLVFFAGAMASAAAGGEVDKALAEVRNVKADMFSTKSSVLGELASPAELAAAQPDRLEMFRPTGPLEYAFTDAERQKCQAQYANVKFKGRPRCSKCYPAGITGMHIRDTIDRVELVVVAVEPSSPAADKVQVNDIIIGANGRLFDDPMDPRPAMGFALVHSQTAALGGKLTLQIVRDAKPINVTLQLPVSPARAKTWPFECERTRQIAADALKLVMDHAPAGRDLMGGGFWTPLYLMASGDPAAMELVTRWAAAEAKVDGGPIDGPGGNNWTMSYTLVNLCEYYLLTGDSTVLGRIRWLVKQIELNQYTNIGIWGHGMPTGYGPVNNVGLICFMGLILARECGVNVSEVILARAIRFFGQFAGTNFGYGEQPPGWRSGRMDNGMNSMGALTFNLLGERGMASRWGRSVCYMWMGREKGHAERIFPMAWGPLGASLSGTPEFNMHMNNLLWYYELMRTTDGGYVFSDYGSDTRGGTFPYPVGSTAAVCLSLYLPQHRLRLLDGQRSVFGAAAPAGLEDAPTLYRRKQWRDLKALLDKHAGDAAPAGLYAKKMLDAAKRLDTHRAFALEQIAKNVQSVPALAAEQLAALKSILGQSTPEMDALAARLPANVGPYKGRRDEPVKARVKPVFDLFEK